MVGKGFLASRMNSLYEENTKQIKGQKICIISRKISNMMSPWENTVLEAPFMVGGGKQTSELQPEEEIQK